MTCACLTSSSAVSRARTTHPRASPVRMHEDGVKVGCEQSQERGHSMSSEGPSAAIIHLE